MAGYSRQSAASIVPTAVVRATPLNNEFNTLRDAFVVATGHKHDGTATEGAYVPLISDTNAYNKVVVDSANNRISLFVNVSGAAVEQLRLVDGAILPVTDNDIDLGSSTFEFKDLFIDGVANIDSLIADTAAISGGTINATAIGGTTPAAGAFTTISATVSATIPSASISGGTINNTIIGGTTPAAGTFTNLTVNTAATIASAAISAGTINGTVIGNSSPAAVTGTLITATTGFSGNITGNVTGNVTASSGTSTFNNATVNGTLSATLTGNVNASSGTSTFNNVTISGTLNMDGATAATITNLSAPVNNNDAATKLYVDTSISNLVNSAPGTLDTLNELAAALGNDPSFATTITNSIATKLSLSGGTMSGAIAMGTNKITGLGDPTNAQDAATKTYVDTQRDTRLALSGGTMTGAIAMSTNKITGLGDPTSAQDAATKNYIDTLFGSTTSAAASAAAAAVSASNAATSASNAATSATNAATSATSAANSATAAAASYDSFDDRYLGSKASPPTLDNDGNTLLVGALYFDSSAGEMRVWTGSIWKATGSAVNGTSQRQVYVATSGQTTFAIVYDVGFVDVYRNGVKQRVGVDFTAVSGINIVFSSGLTAGDIVDIVAYGAFNVANTYTQAQSDARFLQLSGGTMTGNITFNGGQTFAASAITGTLPVANGGTGAATLTGVVKGNGTSAFTAGNVSLTSEVTGTLPVANGGTGAATLTGVLKGNGTSAFTAATAGTDYVAPATATTFTATQTFSGSASALAMVLNDAAEVVTVSATAATGTINYDVTTQSVVFYTSNASANWAVNFRASSGTSLNTALAIGQSVTAAFLVTNGATAYFNNSVQVDGTTSGVTTRWQGGTAPAAGNASSVDVYVYTIIKTANATFSVFASQTRFA